MNFLGAIKELVGNVLGTSTFASAPVVGGVDIKGKKAPGLNYPGSDFKEFLPKSFTDGNKEFLVVNPQDFYKVFPYQFVINANGKEFIYTLPIPPDSLQTKMVVPSEVTPTMGGMVEETSMAKLWMISLSGTTGMAVSRSGTSNGYKDTKDAATKFRTALETTGLLSGLTANVNALASKIGNVLNAGVKTYDAIASGSPGDALAGLSGGLQAALQPSLPYLNSAVDEQSNGYSEIARLQKFIFMYTVLHEKSPSTTAMYFRNIKDRQIFQCVVKDFNVQKAVNEPFLYRYRISLKCWNPSGTLLGIDKMEINRFGPKGDLKTVNTLTVSGAYTQGLKTMGSFNIGKSNLSGII